MAGLKLAVLFTLIYIVYGQSDIYYDTGSGIFRFVIGGSTNEVVTDDADSTNGRRMCFTNSGEGPYYTNGNTVVNRTGGVVLTAPDNAVIVGMSCCCNMIVITYLEAGTNDAIVGIFRIPRSQDNPIYVRHELDGADSMPPAVKCDPDGRRIVLVSTMYIWVIDFDSLATIVRNTITGGPLARRPTCITCRSTGGNSYEIYVSTGGNSSSSTPPGYTLNMTSDMVTQNPSIASSFSSVVGNLICVDFDGGQTLWMVTQSGSSNFVYSYDLNTASAPAFRTTGSGLGIGMVHGISVCGSSCQSLNCTPVSCNCTSPCGFCVYDSDICQCDNSLTTGCEYGNSTIDTSCQACLNYPDAALIIKNPLAKRRGVDGTVEVFGVLKGSGDITVRRKLKIGRYGPVFWPLPYEATTMNSMTGGINIEGFRAEAGTMRRGSRFGVYVAEVDPTMGSFFDVNIIGVVTENSGFNNSLYTVTAYRGDNVLLQASMIPRLLQFVSDLRWEFTRVNQMTGDISNPASVCPSGGLNCTLTNVQKENDEGAYEVFRAKGNRRQRIWHPVFFVFVKACEENAWGSSCQNNCTPGCVNGFCETTCGRCVCLPGWMGNDCNTACNTTDLIGANCNIKCSDLTNNAPDCFNLLICLPFKAGCACRSGLQSPECKQSCMAGKFGPNCGKNCPSGCSTNCDVRTGLC